MCSLSWIFVTLTLARVQAADVIARPEFGTVYTPVTRIENSGSDWINYFQLPDLSKHVIPERIAKSVELDEVCVGQNEVSKFNDSSLQQAQITLEEMCTNFGPVLNKYNKLKRSLILNINRMQASIATILGKPTAPTLTRKRRAAPLEIISSVSKSLFGTARHQDLVAVKRNLFNLQQNVNHSFGQIIKHQDHMESAFQLQDTRMSRAYALLQVNQKRIQKVIDAVRNSTAHMQEGFTKADAANSITHTVIRLQGRLTAAMLKNVVGQVNTLQMLHEQMHIYLDSVQTLTENFLPVALIPPQMLHEVLQQIDVALILKHPQFSIAIRELGFYYRHPVSVNIYQGKVIIGLTVPLSSTATSFQVYETHVIKVPVGTAGPHSGKYAFTQVRGYSKYMALSTDGEYYLELDHYDLTHCKGDPDHRICKPLMVQVAKSRMSCSLALFMGDSDNARKYCELDYYEMNQPDTTILPIGKGRVILASTARDWTLACSKKSPVYVQQCHFCIVTLNCSCALRSKDYLIPASLENCQDTTSTKIIEYPANILAMQQLFENFKPINVSLSNPTRPTPTYDWPVLNIQETDSSQVAQIDESRAMDLKKILSLAKSNKQIYLSKSDLPTHADTTAQHIISSPRGDIYALMWICFNIATAATVGYVFLKTRHIATIITALTASHGTSALPITNGHRMSPQAHDPSSLSLPFTLMYSVFILSVSLTLCHLMRIATRNLARWATERHLIPIPDDQPESHKAQSKLYLSVRSGPLEINTFVATIPITAEFCRVTKPLRCIKIKDVSFHCGLPQIRVKWNGVGIQDTTLGYTYELPSELTPPFNRKQALLQLLAQEPHFTLIVGSGNIFRPVKVRADPEQQS